MCSLAPRGGHHDPSASPSPVLPIIEYGGVATYCFGCMVSLHLARYGDLWFGAIGRRNGRAVAIKRPHRERVSTLLHAIGEAVTRELFPVPDAFELSCCRVYVVDTPARKAVVVSQSGQPDHIVVGAYKMWVLNDRNKDMWRGWCHGYNSTPLAADNPEEALLLCLSHWIDIGRWP